MDEFDDHVLACIFNYLDVRSRCNAMAVCRVWGSFLCAPETWADLSIRTSDDMKMDPADLMKCIKRASGCVTVLRFERCAVVDPPAVQ